MIREPVVSGQFYPDEKGDLELTIAEFSSKESSKIDAKGVVLPHAGYIYSGKVAATTVGRVKEKKRILILGPNHACRGVEFGIWPKGKWIIPGKEIEVDSQLAEEILSKGNLVEESYASHQNEHSIEVQLPILAHFFSDFKIVPISCMQASIDHYKDVAKQIFSAIKAYSKELLIVASTDLTHYEPDATVRRKDSSAISAIINLDENELIRTVHDNKISMCGLAPVAILISILKMLGASKAQVALYQTSADFSKDYTSAVGYVGIIIK